MYTVLLENVSKSCVYDGAGLSRARTKGFFTGLSPLEFFQILCIVHSWEKSAELPQSISERTDLNEQKLTLV